MQFASLEEEGYSWTPLDGSGGSTAAPDDTRHGGTRFLR